MSDSSSDNKRVAKNTLLLYLRMFLIMAVSLYTSRVTLQTLGVSDYGVYNVVGGFVTMLAYLNSVFVDSTQRFLSFSLGEGNIDKLKRIFATSNTIHFVIAFIVLIFAETFGLWFVNNKLVIEPGRLVAANWVFQCSVISLMLTIVNVPYKASIVSHEHMHIYAFLSIIEVVFKLAIVFLLVYLPGDKLIIYALLHLAVSFFMPLYYMAYCSKRFEECRFIFGREKSMFKEMFSYAGWVLIGNLGFSFKDQFSNVIMNLFLGTTINAARGIAANVNSIITSFSNNFMMALSPQITKQYAAGNITQSANLVYAGARYSYYLMGLIIIPVIINIDYILQIWLGIVPEYTSEFVIITLIASALYAITKTMTVAIQATGDIKWFQLGISLIMLTELPIAYMILKLEYPPYMALLPAILTNVIGFIYRMIILKKQVPSYSMRRFFFETLVSCTVLMTLCYGICHFINSLFIINFGTFVLSSAISCFVILMVVYVCGITKSERTIVNGYVTTFIKKWKRV